MGALEDIQRRLRENQYKNEEHVRLSLVARVLQEYGWAIWDPTEVYAEFVPVPQEDRKKVDVALFGPVDVPLVFIEAKAVGGIHDVGQTERQLRDYNRNITARFCIITDGRTWHFYYSLTPGEFGDKRFTTLDLLEDDLDDIRRTFALFLEKSAVQSDEAREQAEHLLSLNRIDRILADCLPEARRAVQRSPYPRLPEALKQLAEDRGIQVSREHVDAFIEGAENQPTRPPRPPDPREPNYPSSPGRTEYRADGPPDLSRTVIETATIGGNAARNWNALVTTAIRLAWERGIRDAVELGHLSGANIRRGRHTTNGFHPVRGTDLSLQYVQASRAWEIALKLAARLRAPIEVSFAWRNNPDAAYPGQKARIHWEP